MAKRSFVGSAVVLMLAGFVVKILGFVYRIYLSNLIGAEGMGLFQLISPIYSLVILTLTSGISIAVSKMVAEEMAKKHCVNLRRITSCALFIILLSGIAVSLVMLVFINPIVNVILKDTRTYYSMLLMIPCVPIVAAASALKGYFYGIQNVVPTAFSQVAEQIVRITLVLTMARYFLNLGLEYTCALATLGMAIGEIANLAVLWIVYKFKGNVNVTSDGFMRKRHIVSMLMRISIPISFNRLVTSIMSAIEMILIPRMLLAGGLNYQSSMEEFGKLTGMAMPLFFFPSLVTASLATTLVPAISEAMSLKSYRIVNYRMSMSIQLSAILGFIFMSVFAVFPHEIGELLYKKQNIGEILYLLSFTSVFVYLQQTLLGIMNGLGKQGISLWNSMIGYVVRIAFVVYAIPTYGIKGYIIGTAVSSAIVCILNVGTVMKTTGMLIDIRNWLIKPGIVGVIMLLIGRYVYYFITIFKLGQTITILLAVGSNVLIALVLLFVFGVIDWREMFKLVGIKKYTK